MMVERTIVGSSEGECYWCRGCFSKVGMTKHLGTCPRREMLPVSAPAAPSMRNRLMRLFVEGRDRPQYWMHLEARASATLELLDDFLRSIWLECCGHLSAFRIGGRMYSSVLLEYGPSSPMDDVRLGEVFRKGMRIAYEYDFGSTTHLTLRVVDEREGEMEGKSIVIMARNQRPSVPCESCGKPATHVCYLCIDEGGWVCPLCAADHECGEETLMRAVNSPRVGTCGYEATMIGTY